jgi:hypothetical protein
MGVNFPVDGWLPEHSGMNKALSQAVRKVPGPCVWCYFVLNPIIVGGYQDRLGTNIGKALKKEAFFAGVHRLPAPEAARGGGPRAIRPRSACCDGEPAAD